MDDILNILKEYEDLLTNKKSERWNEIVPALISDDFTEKGSSGKIYNKKEVLHELESAPEMPQIIRKNFKLKKISDDTYLLKYIAVKIQPGKEIKTNRSSVWRFSNGKWQIIFHEGIKTE